MTTTEKLSKAEIARRLVKHDIVLTSQQVKRTSRADLAAQLIIAEEGAQAAADDRRADIEAAVASHPITKVTGGRKRASNDRDDCTYKTPIDMRDGDGLLTEGACLSRAEDWGKTRDHGVPEAGGIGSDGFIATFTDMTQVSVDLKTGKVKKVRPIDLDRGSPDADVKRRARAAANTDSNVVKLPRASKGINLAPRPASQIKACRADSKQAAIIDCLVDGATLWELTGATSRNAGGGKDWSESSVRSALHWDVHHVKGYGVRTELMTPRQAYDAGHEASVEHWLGTEQEHEAIVPVYFLVLPKGMDKPLPHVEAAPTKMAANKK